MFTPARSVTACVRCARILFRRHPRCWRRGLRSWCNCCSDRQVISCVRSRSQAWRVCCDGLPGGATAALAGSHTRPGHSHRRGGTAARVGSWNSGPKKTDAHRVRTTFEAWAFCCCACSCGVGIAWAVIVGWSNV